MEFLQKTWKFFLGIFVAIIGGMLLFRKDNAAEIIEESTKAGDSSFDKIKKSNQIRNEKDDEADSKHQKEIDKITSIYEKNKASLNFKMRAKIEKSIKSSNPEAATAQLAKFLGADNLDDL
ncbi:MAG: hypothetical protein CMB77_03975 [Euryarchaeota archaeon]|nr:hypothetical protein [Euryarchaeota archaeon]|tara:strand:+ start:25564 stop:25926 length:363 start_codon:yes stop_codon:yes gene_type:complete